MRSFSQIAALSAVFFAHSLATPSSSKSGLNQHNFQAKDIIYRDVAVIGGGSTGTYAAVQLRASNKTVVIIEQKPRIGGHTETYIDPDGTIVELGVEFYHDLPLVHDYFAHFGLELAKVVLPNRDIKNVDISTGKEITGLPPADPAAVGAAVQAYTEQLLKYPDLNNGFFLPDPVPEDLYMPFGDFVTKYHIEAAVQNIFFITSAFGDILSLPTLQVMRTFGIDLVQLSQSGFLATAHHNNSELYSKAQEELLAANSLLLNSTVVESSRGDSKHPVQLCVRTPTGNKLVIAKKLLITIPPKLDFLKPLDTDQNERDLFSKFTNVGYYTAILKNTGLPANIQITNLGQDTPYFLAKLPGIYTAQVIPSATPSLTVLQYGTLAGQEVDSATAQQEIIASLKRIQKENPDWANSTEPEFIEFSNHSPYNMMVGSEETKDGFYKDLYALQGLRNTWWTGATWKAQDSSMSWLYTEQSVLPGLIESLI